MTDHILMSSVDSLHSSIKEFNKQTANQNKRMLQLTLVIAVLTLVMTVAVGVQIYLAVRILPVQSSPVSTFNDVLQPTSHVSSMTGTELRH